MKLLDKMYTRTLTLSAVFVATLVMTGTLLFSGCSSTTTSPVVSTKLTQVGNLITSDTLKGAMKGTLATGHTYYLVSDLIIPRGDTIVMQPGAKIIVLNTSPGSTTAPEITLLGTFASLGTKDKPNYITIDPSQQTYTNLPLGNWAGIQGDTGSGDLILKWTHIEYGGAQDRLGKNNYIIWFQSQNHNFILEDSWITGGQDDAIRVSGGHVSCMRNTFECGGYKGGDAFNVKSGTVGDIAYNVFMGAPTNGPKLSNKGGSTVQTNCNIYNNTIINCGWRQYQVGRSGSTNIEEGARGTEYNNLIVNCRTGLRLFNNPLADTAHVFYDAQFYYASRDNIRDDAASFGGFYPGDGIQVHMPLDVAGGTRQNDPQFVNYDVNKFAGLDSAFVQKSTMSRWTEDMTRVAGYDLHLKTSSPAVGKAFVGPAPVQIPMRACPQGGDFGANTIGLGRDFGAFQSDGTGNQH